jgi:hypothetical protein
MDTVVSVVIMVTVVVCIAFIFKYCTEVVNCSHNFEKQQIDRWARRLIKMYENEKYGDIKYNDYEWDEAINKLPGSEYVSKYLG